MKIKGNASNTHFLKTRLTNLIAWLKANNSLEATVTPVQPAEYLEITCFVDLPVKTEIHQVGRSKGFAI